MSALATVSPEPTPDVDLMDRVHAGDLSPAAELFRRHHRRIFNFCRRLAGSGPADDLTQEVFLRLLRYRGSWRPGSELEPWMFQLARNVCFDHLRRSGAVTEVEEERLDPSREPLQDRVVDSRQRLARLRRALAELPAEKRELLVLARFEGMAYRRIGELVGCTEGAVKVRIHRALAQLRERVEALEEERP